jgi:hypothetical protein
MKGYNYTPLEREKVVEFISRLSGLQKRQRAKFEKLQVPSTSDIVLGSTVDNDICLIRITAVYTVRDITRRAGGFILSSKA